jgi:hypothetical protein
MFFHQDLNLPRLHPEFCKSPISKLTIYRFVRNQILVAVNGDITVYTLYITLRYIKELIQGSLSLIYVWMGSLVQT